MDDYIVVLDDGETYSGDGEVWIFDPNNPAENMQDFEPTKVYSIAELIAGYNAALNAGLIAE